MGKLKELISSRKIQNQFLLISLAMLIIPILIIGGLLLIGENSMIRQYNQDLLNSDNQRVHAILFEITNNAYTVSEDICDDENVRLILKTDYDSEETFRAASLSCDILNTTMERSTQIESVTIYTDNPSASNSNHFMFADSDIIYSEWYQRALSQPSAFWDIITTYDDYGNTYSYLSLIRKIPLLYSDTNAVLVIRISDNYLKARISTTDYHTILSLDDGTVFFSDNRELYGEYPPYTIDSQDPYFQSVGLYQIGDERYLASISSFTIYQSTSVVHLCVYSEEAYQKIRNITAFYIAIIVIAILVPSVVMYIYIRHFSERISILRERIHKASLEDYTVSLALSGHDELAEVYSDLDVLIHNIQEKEAHAFQVELDARELKNEQQQMEYKMLTSQINPHFLYNTLETIRMKAITAGNRDVANAVKLLGKSMRYVLENTATNTTVLSNELDYVLTYLNIQKLRFEDRINYEITIQDGVDTGKLLILPLLLQPIVENSILHGLELATDNGRIDISVESDTDDVLKISVKDNGKGLTEEELKDLREKLMTPGQLFSTSIGLYNIHERIRLYYGSQYGVTIDSLPGLGTTVTITIPKVTA